jgi:PHD/YefM family antitoxin component YafN of YafNO toxin-antitoxin module
VKASQKCSLASLEERQMKVKKKKFIVSSGGRKEAVVLDMEDYNAMLEDIEDLKILAERKDEPARPLEEVEKRLKRLGLL